MKYKAIVISKSETRTLVEVILVPESIASKLMIPIRNYADKCGLSAAMVDSVPVCKSEKQFRALTKSVTFEDGSPDNHVNRYNRLFDEVEKNLEPVELRPIVERLKAEEAAEINESGMDDQLAYIVNTYGLGWMEAYVQDVQTKKADES
jgi:hypothetical protein